MLLNSSRNDVQASFCTCSWPLFTTVLQSLPPTRRRMLTARLMDPHSLIKTRDIITTWWSVIITHRNRTAQPFYFISRTWECRYTVRSELGPWLKRIIPLIRIDAPRDQTPDRLTCAWPPCWNSLTRRWLFYHANVTVRHKEVMSAPAPGVATSLTFPLKGSAKNI